MRRPLIIAAGLVAVATQSHADTAALDVETTMAKCRLQLGLKATPQWYDENAQPFRDCMTVSGFRLTLTNGYAVVNDPSKYVSVAQAAADAKAIERCKNVIANAATYERVAEPGSSLMKRFKETVAECRAKYGL